MNDAVCFSNLETAEKLTKSRNNFLAKESNYKVSDLGDYYEIFEFEVKDEIKGKVSRIRD